MRASCAFARGRWPRAQTAQDLRCRPGGWRHLRTAALAVLALQAGIAGAALHPGDAGRGADDARTQFSRAGEAVKAGRLDEAVEAYTRAESLASTPTGRANAANGAGFVFMKLRRYAEAIPCFERAVAADARHKVAWNNLGVCHLRRFEAGLSGTVSLDGARTAFDAAIALDPAFHPDHRRAVQDYLDQEAACAALTLTASGIPAAAPGPDGTFTSHRNAGEGAEAACAFETARQHYELAEAAATTRRSRAAAANLLGLLALRTRAPQAAVDAFRRASIADPGSKFAWNNLGVALMRLYDGGTGGKELIEQAVDAFTRAQAIDAAYKPSNITWSRDLLTELGGPTISATAMQPSGTATLESVPPDAGTKAH